MTKKLFGRAYDSNDENLTLVMEVDSELHPIILAFIDACLEVEEGSDLFANVSINKLDNIYIIKASTEEKEKIIETTVCDICGGVEYGKMHESNGCGKLIVKEIMLM